MKYYIKAQNQLKIKNKNNFLHSQSICVIRTGQLIHSFAKYFNALRNPFSNVQKPSMTYKPCD